MSSIYSGYFEETSGPRIEQGVNKVWPYVKYVKTKVTPWSRLDEALVTSWWHLSHALPNPWSRRFPDRSTVTNYIWFIYMYVWQINLFNLSISFFWNKYIKLFWNKYIINIIKLFFLFVHAISNCINSENSWKFK